MNVFLDWHFGQLHLKTYLARAEVARKVAFAAAAATVGVFHRSMNIGRWEVVGLDLHID